MVENFNVIYNSQVNKWCDISFHHLDFRKKNPMDLQTSSPKLFNKESYLSVSLDRALFMSKSVGPVHCSRDLQILFSAKIFIKTGSYRTIHTFKNYFVTVFSVFSNKWYLNRPLISFKIILKGINIPFFGSFQGHGLVPNGLREGKLTCLQETNYSSTLIESRSLLYSMAVTLARNLSK